MLDLQNTLQSLLKNDGLCAIKGGTEVEDLSFEEIAFIKEMSRGIVPMTVKIGGPEARNDIRELKKIGIDCILAPMIESEYGLKNFILTMKDIYKSEKQPDLAINFETITAFENRYKLFLSDYMVPISHITLGRGDFAASMGMDVDDDHMFECGKIVIEMSHTLEKVSSVGGKITPENGNLIKHRLGPHRINTRHMVFDLAKTDHIELSIIHILEFELELYRALKDVAKDKADIYTKRIQEVKERIHHTSFAKVSVA